MESNPCQKSQPNHPHHFDPVLFPVAPLPATRFKFTTMYTSEAGLLSYLVCTLDHTRSSAQEALWLRVFPLIPLHLEIQHGWCQPYEGGFGRRKSTRRNSNSQA